MTENPWTPGPWGFDRDGLITPPEGYDTGVFGGYAIASVPLVGEFVEEAGFRRFPEADANVRLIAAAPELVAALEALATYEMPEAGWGELEALQANARALLARVRGEESHS